MTNRRDPSDVFDLARYRAAVEAKDARRWGAFFHEDAEWLQYRHADPPARPNRLQGRAAITAFLERVAAAPISLALEAAIVADDAAAYRLWVDLGDGRRIVEHVMLELRDGRISRQIDVEAWDSD